MKKSRYVLLMTGLFSIATVFTSLAGQWVQEGDRWRYQEYDGTYAKANSDYEPQSYYIDSDGDSFAELYYFDENGYMLTNTSICFGDIVLYHIGDNGIAYCSPYGNKVFADVPQGIVNSGIFNGLIKPEFANTIMNSLEVVDTNLGTKVEDRLLLNRELWVFLPPKNKVSLKLIDNKVVGIYGDCQTIFTNSNITVDEVDNILGIKATEDVMFKEPYYVWELQKNPSVTLGMKANDSLELREISISVSKTNVTMRFGG